MKKALITVGIIAGWCVCGYFGAAYERSRRQEWLDVYSHELGVSPRAQQRDLMEARSQVRFCSVFGPICLFAGYVGGYPMTFEELH